MTHEKELGPLASRLASYEKDILHSWRGSTFRGVRDREYQELYYVNQGGDESSFNLISEITGRAVGDVGSGLGGLAKTAAIEEIDVSISSIHPHMNDPEFRAWERQESVNELQKIYPGVSKAQIIAAQASYESRAVAGFAHKLSFPDSTFDVLVDSYAAHQYMSRENGIYEASIQEMLRVVQPGGKIIVLGGLSPFVSEYGNLPASDFRERTLQQLGIPFKPLYKKTKMGERASVGAIIQKPL